MQTESYENTVNYLQCERRNHRLKLDLLKAEHLADRSFYSQMKRQLLNYGGGAIACVLVGPRPP